MRDSDAMPISMRAMASRARLVYWANIVAFSASTVVFGTGLVLLTQFHMGEGALNNFALGATRLTWVNVHRLTALVLVIAVGIHAYLHWRAVTAIVSRAFKRLPGKASRTDLVLYFGFAVELMAGFLAFFVLPGSPKLVGPVTLTHLVPARHLCIDIHNITGLILLPAVIIHLRRHFDWLLNALGIGPKGVFRTRSIDD